VSLQHLYTELLLDHDTPIDASVQGRIAEYALRTGDTRLLSRLVDRPDLHPDADALVATSADLPVLVNWLLRPGRPAREIVERVAREKRVTVLATLATTAGLPAPVYQDLAAHHSERVLREIITAGAADEAARRTAIRGIVSRPTRQRNMWKIVDNLRDLVNSGGNPDALWEEIGDHSLTLPHLLAVTIYSAPTAAHIERWTLLLEDIHDHDHGRWRNLTGSLVTEITARSLTPEQHRRLLDATTRILERAGQRCVNEAWYQELDGARGLVRRYPVAAEEGIRRLAAERDPEQALELLDHLRGTCTNRQLRRLVDTAMRHPNLPSDALVAMRHGLDVASIRDLATRLERERRNDLLAMWLDDHHGSGHVPPFVSFLEKPRDVLDAYLGTQTLAGRHWPAWSVDTHAVRENPHRALEHLPWDVVANTASSVPGLAAVVTCHLIATLGTDDERWQTFESIGADFTGTLAELLGTVEALDR